MLREYNIFNESEMREWDEFVLSHPEATPFHLSCWIRIIHETYSFRPRLFLYKNNNGDTHGIFPFLEVKSLLSNMRMVSLPFSDYGGPLFRNQYDEENALNKIIGQNKHSVKSFEVRSYLPGKSMVFGQKIYKRHILDFSLGLLSLEKKINKRTIQYSIRKAKKKGVAVTEDNTSYGMEEFYRLNKLTRKKHGIPGQPLTLFRKIYEYMVEKGHASVFLAISDGKAIAASVFFKLNNTLYYKYNASDPECLSNKTPNHLLIYCVIEHALKHGFQYLDFGRSSPHDSGLLRYKELWGAASYDCPYCYYPSKNGATSHEGDSLSYRLFTRTWKSLPDLITDKMGPRIYKYLG